MKIADLESMGLHVGLDLQARLRVWPESKLVPVIVAAIEKNRSALELETLEWSWANWSRSSLNIPLSGRPRY